MIFIDWFYPAYKAGGPIKSVNNIVKALSNSIDFFIVTSNKDLDSELLNVQIDQWIIKEGYEIIYLTKEKQTASNYKQLFNQIQADILYFNSIFSIRFTFIPYKSLKRRARAIIAPRGMLGKGALQIKSFKKKIFLSLSKYFLFSKDLVWHASTVLEEEEIKLIFGKETRVKIAQNLSSTSNLRMDFPTVQPKDELRLIFFSRISEKKNLIYLLKLIGSLNQPEKIKLDIYGPIEDEEHWKQCKPYIGEEKGIHYCGILSPEEIKASLQKYHFSVLPTQHENYGHTIVESINAGVPVLISENTPWKRLEQENIGWDLKLEDKQAWKDKIINLTKMDKEAYKAMTEACFSYSQRNIVSSAIIDQNQKLFQLEHKS